MVIIQCFQILSDGQFSLLFFQAFSSDGITGSWSEVDRKYPNIGPLFDSFQTRCYVTFRSVTVKVTCHNLCRDNDRLKSDSQLELDNPRTTLQGPKQYSQLVNNREWKENLNWKMSKNQPVIIPVIILVIILKYLQIGLRWGKLFFQYENEMYPSQKRIGDRRTYQTFSWRIFLNWRDFQTDADLWSDLQSNWTYVSSSSIPLKDDSDVPDTPYSMPDSGFSEFDFGEENENNETPTSELLRKCRIARMESTLAKVRGILGIEAWKSPLELSVYQIAPSDSLVT